MTAISASTRVGWCAIGAVEVRFFSALSIAIRVVEVVAASNGDGAGVRGGLTLFLTRWPFVPFVIFLLLAGCGYVVDLPRLRLGDTELRARSFNNALRESLMRLPSMPSTLTST